MGMVRVLFHTRETERVAPTPRLDSPGPPALAGYSMLEGHCDFLMSDDLPHETENTVYRYLIAISRLRLGILTEQGEGP